MTKNVIIVGAPRSGTNILRDVLTSFLGIVTWPCDEINYIWRHGNTGYPTDEFTPEMASRKVAQYIRSKFESLATRLNANVVLEKTCANSLRLGFVDAVLPDAYYIFIIRDGRDIVPSAMRRWRGIMEIPYLPYIMKKARFVPLSDMPYYAIKYFKSQLHRITSNDSRLSFWGPRFKDFEAFCHTHSLADICAMQWRRCVERSETDFAMMDEKKICRVYYEKLAFSPVAEINRILRFLGMDIPEESIVAATQTITSKSVGNWKTDLSEKEFKKILPIIDPLLREYGYR